jgi:probable rRNA maturation factor
VKRRRSAPDGNAAAGVRVARDLCHRIVGDEGVTRAEVNLVPGGDQLLRQLNRQFRGLDRTTDVLSFTYDDEPDGSGRWLSGEIIVSVPRVIAQAKRRRAIWGDELARLLVHGALHLCGHDHKKDAERRHMRARERAHLREVSDTDRQHLTALVERWRRELEE